MIWFLRCGLAQSLDALGAQQLVYHTTLLHNDCLLQIRFVRAVGGTLGERAIVTEGSCFTAVCAFSHFLAASFLAIIPGETSIS
jgi:hypothetical protein